jgi:drug/metabolite transporter (DMT)-like permease
MFEPALFGLLAAFFWGTTDFVSRFPSKMIGPGYSTAYMQLLSLLGFSVYILLAGLPVSRLLVESGNLVYLVLLAGVLNVFGLIQLYRAFSVGNMSLAAPIGSSYPIFTILLGFIILGQSIGLEKGIAIGIVVVGVMMTGFSSGEQTPNTPVIQQQQGRNVGAIVSALIASVFFGAAYLCLDAGVSYFGSVISIWLVRLAAVVFSFPLLYLTTKKFIIPMRAAWKWLALMAVLDSSGFAALSLGYIYSGNSPAIVTTLSSLLGAVTTILATLIYKDKLTKVQFVGIVILFLGVILVLNVS